MRCFRLISFRLVSVCCIVVAGMSLSACHGVSMARVQTQPLASYHIEYYQISER